jgi:hypothetical protein
MMICISSLHHDLYGWFKNCDHARSWRNYQTNLLPYMQDMRERLGRMVIARLAVGGAGRHPVSS